MTTDIYITPHAVARFRERIAPQLSPEAARQAIVDELREHGGPAKPLRDGRGVYIRTRGGRYTFRAVICRAEGDDHAVVTVLRSGH